MKKPFGRENEPTDGILTVFFGGGSNKIPVKKDGKFSFLPEYSIQYNSGIFLSATDRHDNPKISIVLDTDTYETELDRYLASLTDSLNEFIVPRVFTYTLFKEHFTYDIAYHQWLEEVVIRKEVKQEEFSLVDIAMLKREVPKAEIERFHTLEDIVDYYSYYFSNSEDVFFCVDGVLRYHVEVNTESLETSAASGDSGSAIGLVTVKKVPDRSVLYEIPPESIERFVMVKGWDAMSLFDVDRVIDIKLKPLSEREAFSIFKNPIQIKKFAVAKEFYTPVYESPESKMSQIPDLRKTIYWNNEIHFNEEGVARLKFYNGDRYTTVKCILEGISDHGIPVHAEYKYRINLN